MDKKQESQVPILTPKKVRGTATIYGSGDIDFRAYGEGGPAKEVIKSIGSSQLYKTTGAKSPKLCAHLMCPDDDPDPQSTFDDLLGKIMKGYKVSPKPLSPRKRDRVLWNEGGLKVWLRSDDNTVEVSLTLPLGQDNLEKLALMKFQNLYQCFSINKQLILRAHRAQSTSSTK